MYIAHTDVEGESQTSDAPVREATNLTCSIAIAPNKLLAKIGSELDKLDGLTILAMADLESRIWPQAAKKVNGIGRRANEPLTSMEITTVAELTAADPAVLPEHLGRTSAAWPARISRGLNERAVVVSSKPSR